ncbi:MAG: formyltransferase family protein [Candidatus Hydrogenedentota bacterium]
MAARIAEKHEIVALVMEAKYDVIRASSNDEIPIMAEHLAERDRKEKEYFAANGISHEKARLEIPPGAINEPAVFDVLRMAHPELILLFGTHIVKNPILDAFEGRIINLHLGLSPYYRGAATNFWPLVNNEPECVGATIHHATLKTDGGPVLHQVRPDVLSSDGAHDFGCKTIIAAANGLLRLFDLLAVASPPGISQDLSQGKVFRRKDFSAEAVRLMRGNFESGMVASYLQEKSKRDAARPLISVMPSSSSNGARDSG